MKITAITKFKHGGLWNALKKLGWSQKELAKRADIQLTAINEIVNLKRRPTKKQAEDIQRVFGKEGFYLDPLEEWPETFQGFRKKIQIEQTREVTKKQLEATQAFYDQLEWNPREESQKEILQAVQMAMEELPAKEKAVLKMRHGFESTPLTLKECGGKLRATTLKIWQIQERAHNKLRKKLRRKLRHPTIS
jgi:DNA-directed RNA polymerase specialized sigma subunit